jgi:hypothetical protein
MNEKEDLPEHLRALHGALDLAVNGAPDPVTGKYRYRGNGVHQRHEDRMKAWWGLTPRKTRPRQRGRLCPAAHCPTTVLPNVRCTADDSRCACPGPCGRDGLPPSVAQHKPRCVCQQLSLNYDHTYLWTDLETGGTVWTSEPYNETGDTAASRKVLEAYGMELVVSPRSPWFPTFTTLLKIQQAR